jgi:signal transduction histidine kinase
MHLRRMVQLPSKLKHLELRIEREENVPRHIYVDERRLLQVLLNLTHNAIKYTFRGGLSVRATYDGHRMLRIAVVDTGIGIAPNEMKRLCDLFGLIDKKTKGNETGTVPLALP